MQDNTDRIDVLVDAIGTLAQQLDDQSRELARILDRFSRQSVVQAALMDDCRNLEAEKSVLLKVLLSYYKHYEEGDKIPGRDWVMASHMLMEAGLIEGWDRDMPF